MWRAIPVILLLALVPSGTLSKVPADNVILPGRSVGRWSLEMTLDQFVRSAGPANAREFHEILDLRRTFDFHCTTEICAFYRSHGELAFLHISHIGTASRTDRGPGMGSPMAEVLAAYGRPDAITRTGDDFGGYIRLIYDRIGIAFRLNLVTETVVSISIYRPGRASSIWRF